MPISTALFYFLFLVWRNNNSFTANNPVKALYFSHWLRLILLEKMLSNGDLKKIHIYKNKIYIYIKARKRRERQVGGGMILLLFLFFWHDKTVYCCIGIGLCQKKTVFNLILFINQIFLNKLNWYLLIKINLRTFKKRKILYSQKIYTCI